MTVCTTCDAEGKYYVGDVGTELIVDTCTDITAATVARLLVEKPDGMEFAWDGAVYETTKVRYVVQSGDFDQVGEYQLQVYLEMPGWSGKGNATTFRVSAAFE